MRRATVLLLVAVLAVSAWTRPLRDPSGPAQSSELLAFELIRVAASAHAPPAEPLRGVVRAQGDRARGATVALHAHYGDAFRWRIDGFAQRSPAKAAATATVQPDGRFELAIPSKGSWLVRTDVPGLGPCEAGPFELDPQLPHPPIELAPLPAGAIAGRVAPEKEDGPVAGLVVCASRGDGLPLSTRTDARGEYRFERLMPGGWHVRLEREPVSQETGPIESAKVDSSVIPTNVDVRPGETARFDLDLARRPRLAVRLALGATASAWRATLRGPGISPSIDQLALDAAGAARLDGEQPGAYTLTLSGKLGAADVRAERRLELGAGEARCELAPALGSLVGFRADTKVTTIRLVQDAADGVRWTTSVAPDGQSMFAIAALPAGTWRLVHANLGHERELGRVTVEAGKEAYVELL